MEMYRGDTATFQIAIKDGAGVPLDLNGKAITMTARKSIGGPVSFSKTIGAGITITDAAQGLAEITINPTDTASLPDYDTRLQCDVQVSWTGRVHTVVRETLIVVPDVTE